MCLQHPGRILAFRPVFVVVVESLSHVQLFATLWTAARQASLSFTISWSLCIELVSPSSRLIFCHPLLLQPSIFPNIRVFSNELDLRIRWPKYWSFSICPSNAYSGLISFRIEWFALFAVHGNLKNLLQHHSSKASVLWHSAFFIQFLELSDVVETTHFCALQSDSPSHMWHQHLKRS